MRLHEVNLSSLINKPLGILTALKIQGVAGGPKVAKK